MIAQAYYKDARIIRIFSNESPRGIADLPLDQLNNKSADESLRKIGLQRVGRWKDMYFGKQAAVRFRTSNAEAQRPAVAGTLPPLVGHSGASK